MSSRFRACFAHSLSIGLMATFCVCFTPPPSCGFSLPLSQQSSPGGTGNASHASAVDPKVSFAEGQASLQSGDLATAEAAFRRVLSVDPQSGAAYANLGVIAMRRKEWDHA